MKERKMKVEGVMALSQAIVYLEGILESLKEGRLVLETGQEAIAINPPSIVDFEMTIAQKKDKEKIQLEMSWKTDGKGKAAAEVVISSK